MCVRVCVCERKRESLFLATVNTTMMFYRAECGNGVEQAWMRDQNYKLLLLIFTK